MPSGPANPGSQTERLHYCSEHNCPCEQCPTCKTYSYCPDCEKCYEATCPEN